MSRLVREWNIGSKVRHSGCPEWGVGVVTAAQSLVQEGVRCQRLTIRFDKVGSKTISTAFANLLGATDAPSFPSFESPSGNTPMSSTDSILNREEKAATEETFLRLPELATDPFTTLPKRAAATLALYRFTPSGASLLDWAVMQSGMRDPLSRYNRHELETLFSRFRQNLDAHARKTLKELKKLDAAAFSQVLAQATPEAQAAVRRIDINR
ncbi:MAG: DUF3553 domain-containing protein [Phycisphaeraceae bacterium]|nr:DUF3553 domain-containing protein [Phycisphaeraceae bacterium]